MEEDKPKEKTDDKPDRNTRICTKCKKKIQVGRNKLGRAVFKGGTCYSCWRGAGKPGRAKK